MYVYSTPRLQHINNRRIFVYHLYVIVSLCVIVFEQFCTPNIYNNAIISPSVQYNITLLLKELYGTVIPITIHTYLHT